jgi:hypothetical protein
LPRWRVQYERQQRVQRLHLVTLERLQADVVEAFARALAASSSMV